ncbi:MAG TPA: HAMP domain-containing protein, partial [Pseudomonadales bacterium]|nr:HAMP domain-containing protein [Pseudomonadales bacterium]
MFGSVTALVVAGFTATALPLVIALVTGSVQVHSLTRQSERTIVESVHATRASEFVADELVSMERNARQYVVVNDAALLKLYEERYSQLGNTLTQLAGTDVGAANADKIEEIKGLAALVTRALQQQDLQDTDIVTALNNFGLMHKLAGELREAGDKAIDRDMGNLSNRSELMQRTFLLQSAALGGLGVLLAMLFISAILKPIRQINSAINHLGAEKFTDSIAVDGPRDLQEIGERLDWLRTRLQQVEQQKNEFVRHMSHELKTP